MNFEVVDGDRFAAHSKICLQYEMLQTYNSELQSVQILDPKSYYRVKIMVTKVTVPNFWLKIPRKTQNFVQKYSFLIEKCTNYVKKHPFFAKL